MTVATLKFDTLLAAAQRIGITLTPADDGNLYAWITPQEDIVYIGKSVSPDRVRNETGWAANLDPTSKIVSGIVTLLRVNQATCRPLHYDPANFDAAVCTALRNQWEGSAFAALEESLNDGPPTLEQVEEFLIRVAVRYGSPIGNSDFHSQWEGPIDRPADTLAVLAVSGDMSFVVPPPRQPAAPAGDSEAGTSST